MGSAVTESSDARRRVRPHCDVEERGLVAKSQSAAVGRRQQQAGTRAAHT